jgi:predicted Zn-dependent protease
VSLIENLESMLAAGKEDALLRFSLGNAYLESQPAVAVEHLARALALNPDYSAAWKLYAKALTAAGREDDAREAYGRGIATANRNGDLQAAKEMKVFLRRLERKKESGT